MGFEARLVIAVLIGLMMPASSAWPAPPRPMTAPPAGRSVDLKLGETRDLSFDDTAETIDVANPGVVDLFMRDPKTLSILGKSEGATSLKVQYSGGRTETIATVVYAPTETVAEALARQIREAFADIPDVDVRPQNDKVVLSGKTDGRNRPIVEQVATIYRDSVTNQVQFTAPPAPPRVVHSDVPTFTNVDTPDGTIERVDGLPQPKADDTGGARPRE